jgi:glucokinase
MGVGVRSGKGLQHIAFITLGTGLGCGLILAGDAVPWHLRICGRVRAYRCGANGRPCACGGIGCLETGFQLKGLLPQRRKPVSMAATSLAEDVYNAAGRW